MPDHNAATKLLPCGCFEGVHIESDGRAVGTTVYIGGADLTDCVTRVEWNVAADELAQARITFELTSVAVTGENGTNL